MSEKFSLKWNDFQSNVSRTFGLLRKEKEFFDVTLVSDDQHQVQAHKLVLSACSPYFKNILTQNQHSHPLLCLDGINSEELQRVLDYIYQGEVQIFQEQLEKFLIIAQKLSLENLTAASAGEKNAPDCSESTPPKQLDNSTTNAVIKTEPEIKPRRRTMNPTKVGKNERTLITPKHEDTDEVSEKINQHLLENDDETFSCGFCGKTGDKNNIKQKFIMQRHIETHLDGLSYPCQACEKTFRSRNSLSLNSHNSLYHRK